MPSLNSTWFGEGCPLVRGSALEAGALELPARAPAACWGDFVSPVLGPWQPILLA